MRLTLKFGKRQRSLMLTKIDRCLVISVVWTTFMFYLGQDTVLECDLVFVLTHDGLVVAWFNVFCETVSVPQRTVNTGPAPG